MVIHTNTSWKCRNWIQKRVSLKYFCWISSQEGWRWRKGMNTRDKQYQRIRRKWFEFPNYYHLKHQTLFFSVFFCRCCHFSCHSCCSNRRSHHQLNSKKQSLIPWIDPQKKMSWVSYVFNRAFTSLMADIVCYFSSVFLSIILILDSNTWNGSKTDLRGFIERCLMSNGLHNQKSKVKEKYKEVRNNPKWTQKKLTRKRSSFNS